MTDNNRIILIMARTISVVFTPFYLPLVALIVLFMVSYLSMLPLVYKGLVLLIVWLFTCLIPTTLIHLYRRYQGWSLLKLLSREGRIVPYVISIGCYFTCFYIMNALHIPHFMSSIVVVAFSQIFGFNPLWWLCFLIILAGIIGTGRMILRIHTLGEICGGYLLGLFAGFIAVILS